MRRLLAAILVLAMAGSLAACVVVPAGPPVRGAVWVPGHYQGWHWVPGHWA